LFAPIRGSLPKPFDTDASGQASFDRCSDKAKLEEEGHDMAEAVKQLRDFENALESVREHRANIMKMIDQIDKGLA
jgi:hypothetical protein